MQVVIPHEPFNSVVKEGRAGEVIGRILEQTRPEAIYFTEQDGHRGAVAIYNVTKDSEVPTLCEPWFLAFQADCKMRIAMTPADLKDSGLDDLAKSWK